MKKLKQRLTENELHLLIRDQSNTGNEYSQIKIIDKIITEKFSYIGGGFSLTINFEECIFLGQIDLSFAVIEKPVYFKHCYFYKNVSFLGTAFNDTLAFVDCKLRGNLMFLKTTLNDLMADFAYCKQIFCTHDSKFKKVSLNGRNTFVFDEINLNVNSIEGNFYISDCNVLKFSLVSYYIGLQKDCQLEIYKCKINSFYIDDINNNGILKLHYIEALDVVNSRSFLTINKSNLGKAEFIQFDFSSFGEMNVLNSFLGECIFVNTSWSQTNINVFKGKEMNDYLSDRKVKSSIFGSRFIETKSQLSHKKDIFKQIKYALSKQGDSVNEKLFYALEMSAYNKSLRWNTKTFSTKLILSLSKVTSNFGLSLKRPIFLILTNLLPFYLLVIYNQIPNVYSVYFFDSNLEGIINGIAQFFYMLNPIRKFEVETNGYVLILDIWIRVISSYALYNLIRATRRFIS